MNLIILAFGVACFALWFDLVIGSPRIFFPIAGENLQELDVDSNAIFSRYGFWLKRNFDAFELARYSESMQFKTDDERQKYYTNNQNWYKPLGACLFCMSNHLANIAFFGYCFIFDAVRWYMAFLFIPSTTILTLIIYKLINLRAK